MTLEKGKNCSVAVIGGGPGGYVAAIRAAQLGAQVTLIEKDSLGGTCLNVGCIPTKALLHSASLITEARNSASAGVKLEAVGFDWRAVQAYKESVVKTLTGGVANLLKAAGVSVINGKAEFIRPKTLRVEKADGSKQIMDADRIIIATGSVPVMPPIPGLKESSYVLDSTAALSLEALPESLLIIGGGVIGVEFACALNAFGVKVTVVEALPRITPPLDGEVAAQLLKFLKKQGIEVYLSHKVTAIEDRDNKAAVTVESEGTPRTLEADRILCCVGRRAYSEGLGTEAAGIAGDRGRITVNEKLETSVPGVYAVGDCLGQIMLAHTASAQGECAAENCMGAGKAYQPEAVPSCVYSFPEAAGVGYTEEQLKEKGTTYRVGRFPMAGNGRALIENGGDGFVKVLIGDELDEVLGVHILGARATDMIAEATLAIAMEATAEEFTNTIHAHPTITEAVREAFLAADNRAIHIPNRKKR